MKKFLFSILLLTISLTVTANDVNFTNSLRSCIPYTDSGSVNSGNINAQSAKKILGRQNDRCIYKEQISYGGMNFDVTCRFTDAQTRELSDVMDSYNLLQKYSGEEPDLSSFESIQNNPVAKVWNKYLQDTSVCSMSGLQ